MKVFVGSRRLERVWTVKECGGRGLFDMRSLKEWQRTDEAKLKFESRAEAEKD